MIAQLIVLFILILINAFFAATEIAFVSINDTKIEMQAKSGNKKANQIVKMLQNPSKFLATIQIGITLAGFLSSAFAADAFADRLSPILDELLPMGIEIWRSVSIIAITIILSYFTLVFGELVPKRIAMKNPEKIAFATIGIVRFISIITSPFVRLLTFSTNIISKLFGITGTDEETVTEEEIRMMVDVGKEKGTIREEEKELINNVFEFDDKIVSDIMIHRTEVYAIDANSELSSILEDWQKHKYSRIPVYEETIDSVIGVLYIKDLLTSMSKKEIEKIKIKKIMKPAYFISENKLINELFEEFQKNNNHIAIVLDEYGGTARISYNGRHYRRDSWQHI